MAMLTKFETEQMRAAWKLGYDEAVAGSTFRSSKDFAGQPGRNYRNYQDGYAAGF